MAFELPKLSIVGGDLVYVPEEKDLDAAEAQLGLSLPPSFRAFARKYGAGLAADLYMMEVPVVVADAEWRSDLVSTSQELREEIDDVLEQLGEWRLAPDGSKEMMKRLVPFAGSENGDILAWDPAQRDADGEMPIYKIGARKSYVRRVGADLGEFLRSVAEGDIVTFRPQKPWGYAPITALRARAPQRP